MTCFYVPLILFYRVVIPVWLFRTGTAKKSTSKIHMGFRGRPCCASGQSTFRGAIFSVCLVVLASLHVYYFLPLFFRPLTWSWVYPS